MIKVWVDACEIQQGDTVICKDGYERTVCKKDISNGFLGLCIFGYPYGNRKEKIEKVLFLVWYQGKIVRYE
jgi:hypothetical protein